MDSALQQSNVFAPLLVPDLIISLVSIKYVNMMDSKKRKFGVECEGKPITSQKIIEKVNGHISFEGGSRLLMKYGKSIAELSKTQDGDGKVKISLKHKECLGVKESRKEACDKCQLYYRNTFLKQMSSIQSEDEVIPESSSTAESSTPADELSDITLSIDLDETLIHRQGDKTDRSFTENFTFLDLDGKTRHRIMLRPGAKDFLDTMRRIFKRIVIFTSSRSEYADPILEQLDPQKSIHERYYRDNCLFSKDKWVKKMAVLKVRDQYIHMDDSLSSILSPDKSILRNILWISSFQGNPSDDELVVVSTFLATLVSGSTRPVEILNGWNLMLDERSASREFYKLSENSYAKAYSSLPAALLAIEE